MPYGIVTHKCCCGCGNKVVTPLTPTDWKLIYDGQSVSLDPSVGNWSLPCRSHYWITNGRVYWSAQWAQKTVDEARSRDRLAKLRYFTDETVFELPTESPSSPPPRRRRRHRWLQRWRKTT
ncbi:DUF6527 family protein [Ferrimicrobium sp.]|uniref:DUF6527 family protein n=1 Tax=Ferrimicrobium sp. TaxID=2926050 RepID=UPI00345C533C